MTNRRDFIKKTALTSAAIIAGSKMMGNPLPEKKITSGKNTVFLFQGDSITDGNRTRDNDWNHVMGHGYAYLIASRLWYNHPDQQWMFYNRGISGNTVNDLYNRWQPDVIDLKPDVISILVGINDVYGIVKGYLQQSIDDFEKKYREILDLTRTQRPDATIVLCEPFILPGGRVDEKPEIWEAETALRQQVVRKLALRYKTLFVPLQEPFTQACKKAPAKFWIWDGIHPMPAGHELIAQQWIKTVSKELKYIR